MHAGIITGRRAGGEADLFFFFFLSFLSDRLGRLTGSRLSLPTRHHIQISRRA